MPGSVHNDPFIKAPAVPPSQSGAYMSTPRPRLTTKTNNSGGIRGGISNGAPIYFTVGFKPPATIGQAQQTATYGEEDGVLEAKGRHDPCVLPLAVPIVEAGSADDHRLTLSAAGAADGEELIAAAQENRPRKANGGGEGGEELQRG